MVFPGLAEAFDLICDRYFMVFLYFESNQVKLNFTLDTTLRIKMLLMGVKIAQRLIRSSSLAD